MKSSIFGGVEARMRKKKNVTPPGSTPNRLAGAWVGKNLAALTVTNTERESENGL